MSILEVNDLKFKYKDVELYNNVTFKLEYNEHVCLVGDNGTGKSTFMKLISHNLIPDKGKITWLPHITYDYLDQHLDINHNLSINDYLIDVFKDLFLKEEELNKLYESLAYETNYDKIYKRIEIIEKYLNDNDFYQISSKIGNVISGLGLKEVGLERKIKELSGGEKMKVFLAKLLLKEVDVLLMDEPTNFLDQNQVIWLAKYLKAFKGSFIVISHDEAFIREISNVIYLLENKTFTKFKMSYDLFLKERDIRKEQYVKAYQNEQKKVKEIKDFIQKNIVRATTTKRAQSRRKMLEKMELLDKPKNHVQMHLTFPYASETGDEVLKLNDLVVGYENRRVLGPLNYLLKKDKKIAILGRNGVGKTTILKTITNQIKPLEGSFKWNPSVIINLFKQEDDSMLDVTPINYLRYFYHLKTDQELRSILAKVGITTNLQIKPLKELSGGERTKVKLALMTMKKSNVLILDEPTNHLDPLSKLELFDALKAFPGVLILVSHERDFYDELIDEELYFE